MFQVIHFKILLEAIGCYLTISKAHYKLKLELLEEERTHPFLDPGLLNRLLLQHGRHLLHPP